MFCFFKAHLFQKSQKLSFKTDKFATGVVQVVLTVMLPIKQGWGTWKESLVHLCNHLSEFAVQFILQEFFCTKHLPFLMQGRCICQYCINSFASLTQEVHSNPDSFWDQTLTPSGIFSCLWMVFSPRDISSAFHNLQGDSALSCSCISSFSFPFRICQAKSPSLCSLCLVWSQSGEALGKAAPGKTKTSPGEEKKLNLSISLPHVHCSRGSVCKKAISKSNQESWIISSWPKHSRERNSQSVLKISGDSLGWDVYHRIIQAGRDLRLDLLVQLPLPAGNITFPGNLC